MIGSCTLLVIALMPGGAVPQSLEQPVTTSSPARRADAQEGATLSLLVAELDRQNADLQAARREIDVRAARIAPAGALPDPILSASTMAGFTRPPFFPSATTPNGFSQIGIAQPLPARGTRGARTAMAAADVEAGREDYAAQRLALIADLKTTYLDYLLAVHSLEVVADNQSLLGQLRQIAETRFSVGRGLQQDVIKAQVDISLLIERATILEQQRAMAVARLNELLRRPIDAPAPPVDRYRAEPVPATLAELERQIDAQSPALRREAHLVDRSRSAVTLARLGLRPEFMVGVSAARFAGDMPWMYGLDVSVSLPVFAARKQRPMTVEAAAALDRQEQAREGMRSRALGEVARAFLAAQSADRLSTLYTDSVIPQARLALESSLAAYQVGSLDFLSVLTNFDAVFAAQVSQLEQQTRRDQALAQLEPFVGTTFVR